MPFSNVVPATTPWPLALIIGIGLLLLVAAFYWVARLSSEQKRDLIRSWPLFTAMLLVTSLAIIIYLRLSAPKPSPKAPANMRILVAAHSESTTDKDLAFAVSSIAQKLVESLHIDRKTEVWLVAPIVRSEDVDATMRLGNADALLWLHSAVSEDGGLAVFPGVDVRLPDGSLRHVSLQSRQWGLPPACKLTATALQVALEALDLLEPILPDESSELPVKARTPAQYDKLIPALSGEGPVAIRLRAYAWPAELEVVGRQTLSPKSAPAETAVSPPLRFAVVDEDNRLIHHTNLRATVTVGGQQRPIDSARSCLTYAIWVSNATGTTREKMVARLPLVSPLIRAKGTLTMNGLPIPGSGSVAEVDTETGDIVFSIGDLGPAERVLLTGTYLVP